MRDPAEEGVVVPFGVVGYMIEGVAQKLLGCLRVSETDDTEARRAQTRRCEPVNIQFIYLIYCIENLQVHVQSDEFEQGHHPPAKRCVECGQQVA